MIQDPRPGVLFLLMVILTTVAELWPARHDSPVNPFFFLLAVVLFIVKSVLIVFFIYCLAALGIVALIITLFAGESIASTSPEFNYTWLKLAFMICIADNVAEIWRYKDKGSLPSHFLLYLFSLPVSYYGGMVLSSIVAKRFLTFEATGNWFSPPLFVHNVNQNRAIFGVLFLIGGVLFHFVIERRRKAEQG